jgi:putative spermidine/putrescine transport system substrate-binding protein
LLNLTRRQVLKSSAAALAVTTFGIRPALAATEITAVEWGGDVVNAMKKIAEAQDKVQVNWVLHQGGSGAILPKIKAAWPNAEYDYVAT